MDLNLHNWDTPINDVSGTSDRLHSIIDDDVVQFFQEVELAIKMSKNDVYGTKNYLDLNRYVFSRAIPTLQIRNDIMSYICKECPTSGNVQWELDVKFLSEMNNLITTSNGNGIYINLMVSANGNQYVQDYLIGA
jgi:hypothetical protein